MAQPYPLPRALRESEIMNGDGGATYGPFGFKIFDAADVLAYVRHAGEDGFEAVGFSVDKVAGQPFDDFTVTFLAALTPQDDFIVQSSRLHEREVAISKGGAISALELEKELSKQGSVIEELRRDIWRGGSVLPMGAGQVAITGADGRMRPGPYAADIEDAQENAAAAKADAEAAKAARDEALAAVPSVFPATIAALKSLDTNIHTVAYLREPGREGQFLWDSGDLSAQMTVRTFATVIIDASLDQISARSINVETIDAGANTLTYAGHGFVEGEQVTAATSVDGLIAGGRYYIKNATTNTFQLATSPTAGVFDITGTDAVVIHGFHDFVTGAALIPTKTVNGLTAGAVYYAIRLDEQSFKLATSFANAHAGAAIHLTGTTNFTLKELADPTEGRFVTRSGDLRTGESGAWVRQSPHVNSKHCGAKGNGATEDSHALQASIWLGAHLRIPTYTPKGVYLVSHPLARSTRDWLYNPIPAGMSSRSTEAPDNGITWMGDGREASIIRASSTFPDSKYLVTLDGNRTGVSKIVGSRSMAQGSNIIKGLGFKGNGDSDGRSIRGFYIRGCWGMEWDDLDFRYFSGDIVYVGTAGELGGTIPRDEVDNTGLWNLRRVRMSNGGTAGFVAKDCRIFDIRMSDCEYRVFKNYGIRACFVNTIIENTVWASCGNNTSIAFGGLTLTDSESGALCRNVTLINCKSEANVCNEIDILAGRDITIQNFNANIRLPTGGQITGKSGIRLRKSGVVAETKNINIIGGRFTNYYAPSDGPIYEVPYIDILADVHNVVILNPQFVHPTTHVKITSGHDVALWVPDGTDIVKAGATPVRCFKNGVSLGTSKTAWTPVVEGSTTAGTMTGTATGAYERDGQRVYFTCTAAITDHTGTGDIFISGLPVPAAEKAAVSVTYSTLAYTNSPFAEIVGGESRIRIRQAAPNGGVVGVPIDTACTINVSGFYFAAA